MYTYTGERIQTNLCHYDNVKIDYTHIVYHTYIIDFNAFAYYYFTLVDVLYEQIFFFVVTRTNLGSYTQNFLCM